MKVLVAYDRKGLPIAVADSREELAELLGIKPQTISAAISRKQKRYVWVEIGKVKE